MDQLLSQVWSQQHASQRWSSYFHKWSQQHASQRWTSYFHKCGVNSTLLRDGPATFTSVESTACFSKMVQLLSQVWSQQHASQRWSSYFHKWSQQHASQRWTSYFHKCGVNSTLLRDGPATFTSVESTACFSEMDQLLSQVWSQ